MDAEIQALEHNQSWDITPLPKDKKTIGSRWIYKLKLKPDGTVDRHKARLVAKGYTQVEGVDFFESFSPVAKVVTVRVLLALAASKNWHVHQIDVNNAFLHGNLEEEVYMQPPEGYPVPSGHVCKLKKSLYGLKQASRQWNYEFTTKWSFLVLFNLRMTIDAGFVALLVYVDDILIAGPSSALIAEVKQYLDQLFTVKDLGVAKFFLGIEIARSPQGMALTQLEYTREILADTGMTNSRAATTPLPTGVKFTQEAGKPLHNAEVYRRLIGRLLYLGFTRPDISHATQQFGIFLFLVPEAKQGKEEAVTTSWNDYGKVLSARCASVGGYSIVVLLSGGSSRLLRTASHMVPLPPHCGRRLVRNGIRASVPPWGRGGLL
ncbi:Retrovirus-related Pol polyprotein from transposon RE2 [Sesamum angolense]|uniref:Retrovirus-related Pol polyprotein from transposon RE2 n=1 Tax=Sesamum angolense TaxID=2727404 RepID=A0AAE1X0L7_9LAMI|nr:Retrovirus-related Pol polyprotein from transposon RE2 [Sesamum angolense]